MLGRAPPGFGNNLIGAFFSNPCHTPAFAFILMRAAVVALKNLSNNLLGAERPVFPTVRINFLRPTPMRVSTSSPALSPAVRPGRPVAGHARPTTTNRPPTMLEERAEPEDQVATMLGQPTGACRSPDAVEYVPTAGQRRAPRSEPTECDDAPCETAGLEVPQKLHGRERWRR